MKRFILSAAFLTLTFALSAEGAGGLEFSQTMAGSPWSGFNSVTGGGGFGYGVVDEGSLIGGFGGTYVSQSTNVGGPGMRAGFGGMLGGWQRRWGPLVGAVHLKLGAGGIDQQQSRAVALLGGLEGWVGILLFPWCEIGVQAGGLGAATFFTTGPMEVGASPSAGVHISWGAY